MTPSAFTKWVFGILASLIVALTIAGAAWAQTVRADIAVLQERTEGISEIRATLEQIRASQTQIAVDVAAIRTRGESRDPEIDRRLNSIERRLERSQ